MDASEDIVSGNCMNDDLIVHFCQDKVTWVFRLSWANGSIAALPVSGFELLPDGFHGRLILGPGENILEPLARSRVFRAEIL